MTGAIRVTSKRKGGLEPEPSETIVSIDRSNPVLGNRHVLHDYRNDDERAQVIAAYGVDLEADFARKGPKFLACVAIAKQVQAGSKIALDCWCKQRRKLVPCHGDLLRTKILSLAGLPDTDHAAPAAQLDLFS